MRRIEAEYRELDRAVRALARNGLDRPVPGFGERARIRRERWTYKDTLAHIVTWKDWQLAAMQRVTWDPSMRGLTTHQQNRRVYKRWHRRPAQEVIDWHRRLHRQIMRTLRVLPAEVFATKRSAHWPADLVSHSAQHRKRHLVASVGSR
jgi:hypothetical protein